MKRLRLGLLTFLISASVFAEVSVCDRTSSVKFAILDEVESLRLEENNLTDPICSSIKEEELSRIPYLILSRRLNSIKEGDFAGLTSLKYLDLGDNDLVSLPLSILNELPSLKQVYIGKNAREFKNRLAFMELANVKGIILKEDHDVAEGSSAFSAVNLAIDQLTASAWKKFNLPLKIRTEQLVTSRQEALVIRQLAEIEKAYQAAPFDFFDVSLSFGDDEIRHEERASVSFNGKKGRLTIIIPMYGRVTADQIIKAVASGFTLKSESKWYSGTGDEQLKVALEKDVNLLAEIENVFIQDHDLLRSIIYGNKKSAIFSSGELNTLRSIQVRTLLNLQRVLNLIVRWYPTNADLRFNHRELSTFLLSWGSLIYTTYTNRFLREVVKSKELLKILNEEANEGEIKLGGRKSAFIPAGSISAMIGHRASSELQDFLEGLLVEDLEDKRIIRTRYMNRLFPFTGPEAWRELIVLMIKKAVSYPLYETVAGISVWLGDTRVRHLEPAISEEQLQDMQKSLRPGDILLSRQDHYLSNAFLPGFWPHTILYLGPAEEWSKLKQFNGVALGDDPWVRKHILPKYKKLKKGRPLAVIEAVSEGVVFNSLEESTRKDYIAVIRPSFPSPKSEAMIAGAIMNALKNLGRPYDFDFDFTTDDKIVCSELVYRAYGPYINFLVQRKSLTKPEKRVPGVIDYMGRTTMPTDEIGRLAVFMADNAHPNKQIDYPGKVLEVISLYMKINDHSPAREFHGYEALEELRRTLVID